jgi:ABC-type dipeptide/oligopeptide/nickel transport system permease component
VTRFLLRRLLQIIPVLVGVATLVFALIHLVPGDPAQTMLGESASAEEVAHLRTRLGLDQPLYRQYFNFMKGAVTANLGTSIRTSQPVAAAIAERLPATAELAVAALAVALLIGIPLGVLAASRAGTPLDHVATTVALIGISIPNFWLGPLLAVVFSIELGWLPVSGRGGIANLVLPAITLGAPMAAVLARMTRASVIEELREVYVLAARARGVSRARAILAHAFRNSLIPIVTVLGLHLGGVLTGAVITETIFAWPGVGRLLVQSISARDYPAVQGCILLIAVIYVTTNLFVDVLYGYLDPRIRYE